MNGCCVITNKSGSAAYFEDVPIPDDYKFDDVSDQLGEIESLMRDICSDFPNHQKRFAAYRDWIHAEKERFDSEVMQFIDFLGKRSDNRVE